MPRESTSFQEHYLISNGFAHMAYKAEDISDIICPYSAQGYETLSDDFLQSFEEISLHLPAGMPVALEISGCSFSSVEQERIRRTISDHYRLRLAGRKSENRNELIRMCWFAVSFLISAALLFLVDDNTENVLVQYAYLPFWFFGYRILIWLGIDLMPQRKNTEICRQIAEMTVFFSGEEPLNEVPEEAAKQYADQKHAAAAGGGRRQSEQLLQRYFPQTEGVVSVICRVKGIGDVIRGNTVSGYEMLTQELEGYLDRCLPYIPEHAKVRLEFEGAGFDEEETQSIRRAVTTFFAFRKEAARIEERGNRKKVLYFILFMLASTLLLLAAENIVNKAMLEFLTMVFWFFGDYLIEFVLLDLTSAKRRSGRIRELSEAEILIPEKQAEKNVICAEFEIWLAGKEGILKVKFSNFPFKSDIGARHRVGIASPN